MRSERAALIGLATRRGGRDEADRSLDELTGLVAAAGGTVVLRTLQERDRPDPATFLGRGKLEELALACDECDADLVVFDHELTPSQAGHIETLVDRRVVDRTQVILDIFARRARTREGKWQVELAQLRYLLPRLAGSSTALSRLGGGIGTRGPGETKLETDRRRMRQRLASVERSIDDVRQRRARLRSRRKKAHTPTVALVGYTNAGKTTLFNRLTHERAVASDALFVTLDPLVRRLALPDGRAVLVSDTVGFIERLPHSLVAAFRATLEEVVEADVLAHVIDVSVPDWERRAAAVTEVLQEVGASDVPRLDVFNKVDRVPPDEAARLAARHPAAFLVSALTGTGRDAFVERVLTMTGMAVQRVTVTVDLSSADGRRTMMQLYRHGQVLEIAGCGSRADVTADIPRHLIAGLAGGAVGPDGGDGADGAGD